MTRDLTLETLITFLTIENNNINNCIVSLNKERRGQHSQFLRCFIKELMHKLRITAFWKEVVRRQYNSLDGVVLKISLKKEGKRQLQDP